jgi:hypothetical protein
MRSTTASRIRPSQRHGSPLRPTRSRVCQRRPSIPKAFWRRGPPERCPGPRDAARRWRADRARRGALQGPAASTGGQRRRIIAVSAAAIRDRCESRLAGRSFRCLAGDDLLGRTGGDDPGRRARPASGPRSMIQSACFTTSRLCSINTTVLPRSTSRCSTSSSLARSSKCSPWWVRPAGTACGPCRDARVPPPI